MTTGAVVPLGFKRIVFVSKYSVCLFEKCLSLLHGLWFVGVRHCCALSAGWRTSGLTDTRWVMRSSTAASCSVCLTAPPWSS